MLPLDQELNIAYSGGSGGHYFLHQLLLADQHWCKFILPSHQLRTVVASLTDQQRQQLRVTGTEFHRLWQPNWPGLGDYFNHCAQDHEVVQALHTASCAQPENLEDIPGIWGQILNWVIDTQWQIHNPAQWKRGEVWVNNDWPWAPEPHSAYQYRHQHRKRIRFVCSLFGQWQALPGVKVMLYTDLATQFAMAQFKRTIVMHDLNEQTLSSRAAQWQGHTVFDELPPLLDQATVAIRLQDFVNDQPEFLGPMNSAQQDLRRRWLALHPPDLLASIGIDR